MYQPLELSKEPYYRNEYEFTNQQIRRLTDHPYTETVCQPFWTTYGGIYDSLPAAAREANDLPPPKKCLRGKSMPMGLWSRGKAYLELEGLDHFETAFTSIAAAGLTDRVILTWLSDTFSLEDLLEMGGDFGRFNFVVTEGWKDMEAMRGRVGELLYAWLLFLYGKVLDLVPAKVFVTEWWDLEAIRGLPLEELMEGLGVYVDEVGVIPMLRFRERLPPNCPADLVDIVMFVQKCYDFTDHRFQTRFVIPSVRRFMRSGGGSERELGERLGTPWFSRNGIVIPEVEVIRRRWTARDVWMHVATVEVRFKRASDEAPPAPPDSDAKDKPTQQSSKTVDTPLKRKRAAKIVAEDKVLDLGEKMAQYEAEQRKDRSQGFIKRRVLPAWAYSGKLPGPRKVVHEEVVLIEETDFEAEPEPELERTKPGRQEVVVVVDVDDTTGPATLEALEKLSSYVA